MQRRRSEGHRNSMNALRSITIDDIRNLRLELMEALDGVSELEHRFQQAESVARKSGVIVGTLGAELDAMASSRGGALKAPVERLGDCKLLSVSQVAARWGCSQRTVRRKIQKGEITVSYLGERTHRIAIEEVERFEEECRG